MNKRFTVLAAALALTLALAACGSTDQSGTQNDPRDDTVMEDGLLDDGAAVTPEQTPAADDTEHSDGQPDDSLQERLEDARVHDRDGDLLDGENHASGTYR